MELEEFKAKIAAIEKRAAKLNKDRKALLEQCPHSFEQKHWYNSGTYNDRAYTEYWEECVFCRKKQNLSVKEQSWYG